MNQQWNPSSLNHSDERLHQLQNWLQASFPYQTLLPLQGAASFRRYYRLVTETGASYVVMDAPPHKEELTRFITIAQFLMANGLSSPHIFAKDIENGFLVLSDFGDRTFLRELQQSSSPAPLYQKTLKTLKQIQMLSPDNLNLPHFTHDFMQMEWEWHETWFLQNFLELSGLPLQSCYNLLVENALLQPQVFMYRDYHSGNLMLLPNGEVGLLDFQDAFIGPCTYDLVSLLRDCYIDWPKKTVSEWALYYYNLLTDQKEFASITPQQFLKWFDLMGLQRHLKALMTFARKALRDQDESYLKFMPRTLNYIISISNIYEELQPLHLFYQEKVLPRLMSKLS